MPVRIVPRAARRAIAAVLAMALAALTGGTAAGAQSRRDFTVTADHFAFRVSGPDAAEIRVVLGDLVRVTFDARDIPHSFTTVESTPHYRIDRRAEPGKPVTFEFRADQAGTVPIRCTLATDAKCRQMTLSLVVDGK